MLYFSSPFFQAVLDGDWKENHPSLHSLSDRAEDDDDEGDSDQSKLQGGTGESQSDWLGVEDRDINENIATSLQATLASPRASYYTANLVFDNQDTAILPSSPRSRARANTVNPKDKDATRLDRSRSLDSLITSRRTSLHDPGQFDGTLQRLATPPPLVTQMDTLPDRYLPETDDDKDKSSRDPSRSIIAVVDLTEEAATTFQDFLCLVYPSESPLSYPCHSS